MGIFGSKKAEDGPRDITKPILTTLMGKNGRLELTESNIKVVLYKKRLSFGLHAEWDSSKIDKLREIPKSSITKVQMMKALGTYQFHIHFPGAGLLGHVCLFLNEERVPEFGKAFNLSFKQDTKWYHNETKLTHIAVYDNERMATEEANLATHEGWVPTGTSTTDGHLKLGSLVLLGGLSLLDNGGRSKGKITITYTRTQEWLSKKGLTNIVSTPSNKVDELTKLSALKRDGAITEDEYEQLKKNLLT